MTEFLVRLGPKPLQPTTSSIPMVLSLDNEDMKEVL